MEQPKKFEVIPAGDITNPPQAPIPVTEMLLAQARVIERRRDVAGSLSRMEYEKAILALEAALADLAEMELHQLKWNIIQRQRMIQEAVSMPPPIHGKM